jgi:uncharacterized protein (DUF4415 family)
MPDLTMAMINTGILKSWFRKTGKGYQTRINNVPHAFVESCKQVP